MEASHMDNLVVITLEGNTIVTRHYIMECRCISNRIIADTIDRVIEESQSLSAGLVKKGN